MGPVDEVLALAPALLAYARGDAAEGILAFTLEALEAKIIPTTMITDRAATITGAWVALGLARGGDHAGGILEAGWGALHALFPGRALLCPHPLSGPRADRLHIVRATRT